MIEANDFPAWSALGESRLWRWARTGTFTFWAGPVKLDGFRRQLEDVNLSEVRSRRNDRW